jgi:hypothetical protein
MQAHMFVSDFDARRITVGPEDVGAPPPLVAAVDLSATKKVSEEVSNDSRSNIDDFEKRLRGLRKEEKLRKAGIDTAAKADQWADLASLLKDDWVLAPTVLAKNVLRMHLCARTFDPVLQVDKSSIGRIFEPDHVAQTILFSAFPPKLPSEPEPLVMPVADEVIGFKKREKKGATFYQAASLERMATAETARNEAEAEANVKTHGKAVTREIPLNNKSNSVLYVDASCEPADYFKISAYSSLSTSSITLAGSGATAAARVKAHKCAEVQGAIKYDGAPIALQPGEHMTVLVKFLPPLASKQQQWPLQRKVQIPGDLRLQFSNGTLQTVPLEGILLRPVLVCSPREHDFGNVHTQSKLSKVDVMATNKQTKRIKLANPSGAHGPWKLMYVPRRSKSKSKKTMSPKVLSTSSNPEFDERLEWLDDPTVFEFSRFSGKVRAGADSYVDVTFTPKERVQYYCQFRLEVPHAALGEQDLHEPLTTIHLSGMGSWDEIDDHDYDTTF